MSEVKNKKKKSSMIQVSIGVLTVILAILIIIMMEIVSDIQGTARIVNYTGLVRGETQRIIKLEVAGEQDDAMIQEVRSFIDGLRNGNTKLNLVYLNDTDFQNKMQELDEGFSDLYKEICLGRSEGYEKTDIISTGHSASIALMTCANDDTVINRILLINPESIIDASKTPKHYNKVLKYILCTPIIGTFIYNLLVSKDRIEENFMTDYFYDHCKFKKRDLAAYVEASQSEKSHGRYLYANICSNFTNTNVLNCLSKIDNSIFIIVGNGNPEYSLAASQYQNQLPAIEICEINKTKYLPQLEAPTDVLENIKIYFDLTA